MESAGLREKLHKYIDLAEEKKIEEIYTMLEHEIISYSYNPSDIEMFHERRRQYLEGETVSYTVDESFALIRNLNK